MSLLGIGTSISSNLFSPASAQLQLQASVARERPAATGRLADDTVSLSPRAQFLGSLQALQASDPQKFKQVLTQAAGELQSAAGRAGDTARGQSLSDLARKFQDVADSGDISRLKPAAYANRVQQAYGTQQPDGVQELLNTLGQSAAGGSALSAVTKSVVGF
jgi:hypothetical protein